LVARFLRERGLDLSVEKTVITPIADGFDFLGQRVRKHKDKLLIKPSRKSVKTLLDNVRQVVRQHKQITAGRLICVLNPLIRGWALYHRHAVSKRIFAAVDSAIFRVLWRWATRRHPTKSRAWVRAAYFHTRGDRPLGLQRDGARPQGRVGSGMALLGSENADHPACQSAGRRQPL